MKLLKCCSCDKSCACKITLFFAVSCVVGEGLYHESTTPRRCKISKFAQNVKLHCSTPVYECINYLTLIKLLFLLKVSIEWYMPLELEEGVQIGPSLPSTGVLDFESQTQFSQFFFHVVKFTVRFQFFSAIYLCQTLLISRNSHQIKHWVSIEMN